MGRNIARIEANIQFQQNAQKLWRYIDQATGFEFYSYTRDVPIGKAGVRVEIFDRVLCAAEFEDLGYSTTPEGGQYLFRGSVDKLRTRYLNSLNSFTLAERKEIGSFEERLELLIIGWQEALNPALPGADRRAAVRIDLE